MEDYRAYFKGKKITVMGLGLLGRGVGDAVFLAECGAKLTVTDLKDGKILAPSLKKLKRFKNIRYTLGKHDRKDFRNQDMILKAASVPLDSPFISESRKNRIPVEMSTSLFARLSPATLIGVTGTRGKSTVTHLVYEILKQALRLAGARSGHLKRKVFLGGNVYGVATLPLLKKIKPRDLVVLELDSWQLQGFGESRMSPHIAVFSTFMEDHINYYKGDTKQYLSDKAQIFLHQKRGDYLILGKSVAPFIKRRYGKKIKGTLIRPASIPSPWNISLPGEHNKENVSLAVAVARILKVKNSVIQKAVESFRAVPGRLELVREVEGVKFYNDTTATTPEATIAGLKALSGSTSPGLRGVKSRRNIILILGGSDKELNLAELVRELPKHCKALVLLSGTGTDHILYSLKTKSYKLKAQGPAHSLKEALEIALTYAQRGDTILLSPAFASFGLFKNVFDRGAQFNKLVKKL